MKMARSALLILLSIFPLIGAAQNQIRIDSLEQIVSRPEQTIGKANAYVELSEELYIISSDTLSYFCELSLATLDEVHLNNANRTEYKRIRRSRQKSH